MGRQRGGKDEGKKEGDGRAKEREKYGKERMGNEEGMKRKQKGRKRRKKTIGKRRIK